MNTALRFPAPGQRLTADFGRQLARNINSLRITGGPGVRVTQGPNGVTISAASQGGGGSSSASGDYFPFRLSAYMDADSGKHYAVVMANDGSVQILPSGTGQRFATVENAEATMAVENGWRLVAGSFSCAKDAKTEAVTTTVTDLATLEDYAWDKDDPRFDVYAVIYRTADETYSFVVTDTLEQPGAVDPLGEDAFVACVYVGTFQRTYDEDTKQYSYGVSNQVLRSALVLREEADEDVLRPFKMKVWTDGDGVAWPCVYCPAKSVQIDRTAEGEGVASATALNTAASGAGDDWLYVGGAFGTDGSPTVAKADALSLGADGTAGVWLFVSKDATTSAYKYAVAATESWPTAVDEASRVAKVYLGSFAKTTAKDADGNSKNVYSVASQVVNDAQIVRTGGEEELYPFKLKRVNEGTETSPSWKTVIYLPENSVRGLDKGLKGYVWGSVDASVGINVAMTVANRNALTGATGMAGWYYVGDNSATNVYLLYAVGLAIYKTTNNNVDSYSMDAAAALDYGVFCENKTSLLNVTSHNNAYRTIVDVKSVLIGTVDVANNTATNLVRSCVCVDGTPVHSQAYAVLTELKGGSSGSAVGGVVAEDKRTNTTKVGVIAIPANASGYIYDDTATNSKVLQKVAIENALGDDCVGLTGNDQPTDLQNSDGVVELGKYLKGGVDEDGAEYGYGKNINTANFEDKCLPKNEDQDVVTGTATTAARSDHKHYSSDIYYEDENEKDVSVFSSIDAFLSYLESLKPTDTGETLPENETPDGKRLVTFDDLIKANTSTQGADGIGTDKVSEQEPPTSMTDASTSEDVEIYDLPGYILKEAYLKTNDLYRGAWNRATDGTSTEDGKGKGFKYTICCGVKYVPSKGGVYLVFREISVDRYGMVYDVSAAKFALQVVVPVSI
jgi:hypothetical protein